MEFPRIFSSLFRSVHAAAPDILELRIHGVLNSPPSTMLGAAPERVQRVSGDDLAGFYTVVSAAGYAHGQKGPDADSEIPTGIHREAYSWGGLNRYAPTVGGRLLGKTGRILTQIAWLLLAPFGLCNAAYWARPLPGQEPEPDVIRGPGPEQAQAPGSKKPPKVRDGWRTGNGAGAIRLFALILTLLYTTSFASISLDLVGVQCFPSTGTEVCSQLPGFMDGLAAWQRGQRLAVLSVIPLAAILLLFWVSVRARLKYEANIARTRPDTTRQGDGDNPKVPVLTTPRFWEHAFLSVATERLHLAAAIALIAFLLLWDGAYAWLPGCDTVATFFNAPCDAGLGLFGPPRPIYVAGSAIALGLLMVVLAWTLIRTGASRDVKTPHRFTRKPRNTADASERSADESATGIARPLRKARDRASAGILVAAILLYIGTVVHDIIPAEPDSASNSQQPFEGLVFMPLVLVALALGLAVAGLGWRRGVRTIPSFVLFCFFLTGGIAIMYAWTTPQGTAEIQTQIGASLMGLSALVWTGLMIVRPRQRTAAGAPSAEKLRYQGWGGTGPGVVMLAALAVSLILASVLVVGAGSYITLPWPKKQTSNDGLWRLMPTVAEPQILMPSIYVAFGVALIVIVLVLIVTAFFFLRQRLRGLWVLTTPPTVGYKVVGAQLASYSDDKEWKAFAGTAKIRSGQPPRLNIRLSHAARLVIRGRRLAGLAHVGECFAGILAGAIASVLMLTLFASVYRNLAKPPNPQDCRIPTETIAQLWACVATNAEGLAISILGAVALLSGASIVAATATSHDRPLALLWDLICFLPRAGHPFGPPCYAERAVPELQSRIVDWLNPEDGTDGTKRRVIISAHSQGAVLAVSVILSLRTDEPQYLNKIGLITYGTQLRPYFGRFLPELLGPMVTGGRPCRRPSLWTADPWLRQVNEDLKPAIRLRPPRETVRWLLTDPGDASQVNLRWSNLWRRTDFLGFPADSYGASKIDHGAEELDRSAYMLATATHDNYPASAAYCRQLKRLTTILRDRS